MLHAIQGLRALAAAMVVLYHAVSALLDAALPVGATPGGQGEGAATLRHLAGFGASGVDIFFVISGLVMILAMGPGRVRRSASRFWRRRLARIYPPYWLAALLAALLAAAMARPLPEDPLRLLGAVLLLPYGAPALLFVAWTLAYETYFYLVFGLALTRLRRPQAVFAAVAGVFALSVTAGELLRVEGVAGIYFEALTSTLLLEFVAGMAVGLIALSPRRPPPWCGALALVAALAGFAAGMVAGYDAAPRAILWGLPATALVLGAVLLERGGARLFAGHLLGRLGDASYAIYLIHPLVIALVLAALPRAALGQAGPGVLALAALATAALSIAAGETFHLRLERPLIRIAGRLLRVRA